MNRYVVNGYTTLIQLSYHTIHYQDRFYTMGEESTPVEIYIKRGELFYLAIMVWIRNYIEFKLGGD